MKIGCVYAKRKTWPMWDWVARAVVNAGHEAIVVNHVDDLMAADAQCDFMLFEHRDCGIGWRHVRDNAANRKSPWVQWNWDLIAWDDRPLREQDYIERHGMVMPLFDLCLVKEKPRLDEFRELRINAAYMDQGCRSDSEMVSHLERPHFDVMVFGQATNWYKERIAVASQLAKDGLLVGWATNQGTPPNGCVAIPWCPPADLAWLMSCAKCTLDIDLRSDVDGYWSDRHWIIDGHGAIGIRLGEGDGVDKVQAACSWAHDVCQMPQIDRWNLGCQIQQRAMNGNTYEDRIESIIDHVARIYAESRQAG